MFGIMCALAAIIRFERIEEGEKNIRVTFIDSDGRPVMPALQKQIKVQFPAQATDSHATMHLVLLIQQIRLPNFGEYSINLAIDGRQQASIPLFVRQSRAPQAPQPLPPSE